MKLVSHWIHRSCLLDLTHFLPDESNAAKTLHVIPSGTCTALHPLVLSTVPRECRVWRHAVCCAELPSGREHVSLRTPSRRSAAPQAKKYIKQWETRCASSDFKHSRRVCVFTVHAGHCSWRSTDTKPGSFSSARVPVSHWTKRMCGVSLRVFVL